MSAVVKIVGIDQDQLLYLVASQLQNLIPDNKLIDISVLRRHLPQALERLRICVNSIRLWEIDTFDYLHSSQYCTFIYYLANTIWNETGDAELPTRLFILNKSLNSIDLFYEIQMPKRFFIGHSLGIVLSKAQYSDYLAIYQNCTIGKNHGMAPVLEPCVLIYPNAAIIGSCLIRSNTILSQGVSVVNSVTPGNSIVFPKSNGMGRKLLFKQIKKNGLHDIFRL